MWETIIENNFNLEQLEYLIRVILACLCGLVIGYERSKRQKEAGLRTHIILCMGCAVMTIVSKYGFLDTKQMGLNVDATRVAANIITGIGFLGAGVIFVRGGSVRGLTTAAGVWATSGIGLAIGSGMYTLGIACTIILILVQITIHKIFPVLETLITVELNIKTKNNKEVVERIKNLINEYEVIVNSFKIKKRETELEIRYNIRMKKFISNDVFMTLLAGDEDIIEVSTTS